MDKLKIEQAIGSLLSARVGDTKLDHKSESALSQGTVGGIVLFKENGRNLKQLAQLIADIRSNSFHNPIISADQEGGAIQRFDHLITPLPSAMALAAANDFALLSQVAALSVKQLELLGFNCILAPVLDVLQNPVNQVIATRSYGNKPDLVSKCARHYLEAVSGSSVIAVGKHFPGHGSTNQDSHFELAVNDSAIEDIWLSDLAPFKSCLEFLPAILVGHVWLPSIDKDSLPATLSSRIITDILRNYLHYDGLVMTDSFDMKAITDKWSVEEASLMAINAGADHLLLCVEVDQLLAVHKYLVNAVSSGKLKEERILASIKRTQRLFKKSQNMHLPDQDQQLQLLQDSMKAADSIVFKAATKGISALKGSVPTINSGEWLVIKPNHARYPLKLVKHLNKRVEEISTAGQLENVSLRFIEVSYTLDPSDSEAEEIGKECAERNCIFLTMRSLANQGQFLLAQAIKENAREHLHIACDLPYDLIGLTDWQNCLATFDPSDLAMRALAEIILGAAKPTGICPVDLNLRVRIGETDV